MRSLAFPKEPRWLDLPRGVRVLARPIDTSLHHAAIQQAARKLARLLKGQATAVEIGLGFDLPALDDQDIRAGVTQLLIAQAFARFTIVEWEGVPAIGGDPAPVSPDSACELMLWPDIAESFVTQQLSPIEAVAAEGNASAPSPTGISAAAARIAETAAPPNSLAPGTAPVTTT